MIADQIFTNGRFYTLDPAGTVAEAIAVKDGKIIAVGSSKSMKEFSGQGTVEADLAGKAVIPGCIDCHNHLIMHGVACTRSADLTDCRSIAELQDRLRTHLKKNPGATFLTGERFDQEIFAEGRWVTKDDLDEISRDIPILVARLCYHAVVVNSAVLERVKDKITPEQWETGKLTEGSVDLGWSQMPECTEAELEKAILHAFTEARNAGITTIHCQIDTPEELAIVRRLRDEGRLPVRVRFAWPYHLMDKMLEEGSKTGSGDDWVRVGAIKIFMDGSMGARTCAMLEPFTDDPGNIGELFRTDKELAEQMVNAQRNGFQVAVHAIGDRAIAHTISAIEMAMPQGNEGNVLRHRIEHVAQMSPKILEDMARLNIMGSVQPQFIITDFWTHERVGPERYKWCYPFKSMLKAGITLGMGSDCPVEILDTMQLLHRAVNRDAMSQPECLTVEETLRGYTNGSAYIGFEEQYKGSLEVGKLADFVILSEDPFEVDRGRLESLRPVNTVVGGQMQCGCGCCSRE